MIYVAGRQKRHSRCYPATLTRAQHKVRVDLKYLRDLNIHDSHIPVRKILGFDTCLSMAKKVNRDQVDGTVYRIGPGRGHR
jgi:hypothetical protein